MLPKSGSENTADTGKISTFQLGLALDQHIVVAEQDTTRESTNSGTGTRGLPYVVVEDMKETMERVAVDEYYETRGKVCWHCAGTKMCNCISCPGKCVVCS